MLTIPRVEELLRIAQESGVVTDHNRQIPLASRVQKFTSVVLLDKIYANLRSVLRPQYAGLSLASILTGVFVAFLIQPIENSFLKIGVLAVVGILISLLCVITWKMGFRLAKVNARRELINTLCDSDEAIILAKSDGKVICDTAAFRQLISNVDGTF